jgi:hypothetical protein
MVYVDDMAAPFGRMKMYHLIADTTAELLAMVDAIGVQRKWIQHAGTYKEHFDISQSKRQLALAHGAQPITWKEYARKVGARRTQILERLA